MRIGAIFSQADSGTNPTAIRSWAETAEDEGFEHILAYDHILGASPERLGPGPFGPFPGPPYTTDHVFHEIVTLFSYLAGATSTLSFVSSAIILPQRQAQLVAKQLATLDLLSNGRLRVAVGAGWNGAEYEALGVDFDERSDRLREQMEVMRLLWTEPVVSYRGRFHELDRVGLNPCPGRPLPITMATRATAAALRRVVRDADGWMPLVIPDLDGKAIGDSVRRLRQLCEDAGRDPDSLPIHGRVYLGDGWQVEAEEAVELGFSDLSLGFNRLVNPGVDHDIHLEAILEAKPTLDAIVS